jgi:diguanylate cyclase (GGDEF)-like protein
MRPTTMASTAMASPRAGLLRVALAVVVALLVSRAWPLAGAGGAYLAAGIALVFGVLLIVGRPEILLRERLLRTVVDSLLISVLIAYTGGAGSPFFPLFLLAALGMIWIEDRAKVAVATVALAGVYLAAVAVADPGALDSGSVLLRAGFLALFCAVVGLLGSEVHGLRKLALGLSSTLANEIDRVERDESLISKIGPVLKVLSLEGVLQWTAEAAHAAGGGSYAHVAALNGNHHRTVSEGDLDACPSWWHPSIQRLVLWSCREGDTVRSEETIHGIEGFIAVPVGSAEGEKWGAIVLGGKDFGAEEERALKLLAEGVAPTLEGAGEAPGGLDQLTGLPNRASLRRVLGRELSSGRALTVLAMDLEGFRRYERTYGLAAGDALLRRTGERLKDSRQRAFRYGDDEFVVVVSGTSESRARRVALAIRQLVSEETSNLGHAPLRAAVGFAFAEAGDEDPDLLLGTALRALEKANSRVEGIAGFSTEAWTRKGSEGDERMIGVVKTLVGALEAKDPYIGGHLRAVSRLALRIGREISLPQEQIEALVNGALLHDVGKIGISDQILHKPGRLTHEEYELIKQHPAFGVEIIAPIKELIPAAPVVKHHHERFDGKGYPDALRGEDIPLIARVVSVADAFDSMIRGRPYGYDISQEAALEEIEGNAGTQFDPRIVRALLQVAGDLDDLRVDSAGSGRAG